MRTTISFFVFMLLITNAHCADPAKTRDICRFFQLMNVEELAFADMKERAELQRQSHPEVPDEFWRELFMELKPEEFLSRMVPIYDKHFTHDEIKAWIAFFESAPGQAFLKNQRVVLQESTRAGQAYVEEVSVPILNRLQKK